MLRCDDERSIEHRGNTRNPKTDGRNDGHGHGPLLFEWITFFKTYVRLCDRWPVLKLTQYIGIIFLLFIILPGSIGEIARAEAKPLPPWNQIFLEAHRQSHICPALLYSADSLDVIGASFIAPSASMRGLSILARTALDSFSWLMVTI